MNRRIIRAREAIRRIFGKQGRRRGVDQRKHEEQKTGDKFRYIEPSGTYGSRILEGRDTRSGKDRRKKP